jgi:8-oxo-dGTP pyrophosphatase MutT (NUDIX family)
MSHSTPPIATPVLSATVILARQKGHQLQIYLLKRSSKSGFMAGKYVFPGGKVDPEDMDIHSWENHLDQDAEQISHRLGHPLSYPEILPYCVAVIRETFEEAGVLLIDDTAQVKNTLEQLHLLRTSENLPLEWLRQDIAAKGGILSVSRLFRWSHWITPLAMTQRFDTRFFVAEMPAGQKCRPDNQETTHGIWVSPGEGLAGNRSGKIPLSPPTLVTLQELSKFPDMAALKAEIAHRPWGSPIMPRLVPLSRGTLILEPWDPMYSKKKVEINTESLSQKVLPVGQPFSRIWRHGDECQPVSSGIQSG